MSICSLNGSLEVLTKLSVNRLIYIIMVLIMHTQTDFLKTKT
jgi:hypothetical protein